MTAADVPAVAALHVATFETHTATNSGGPTYTLREYQWRKAFAEHDGSWFGVVIDSGRFPRGLRMARPAGIGGAM